MARKPSKGAGAPETVTPAEGLHRRTPHAVGRASRIVSASQLAILLDVNRGTITKWISDGMPVDKPPEREGGSYDLDVAVVVRWLQKRAMADAAKDGPEATAGMAGYKPADGGETYEEARTRRERAAANAAESNAEIQAVDAAERRGEVVPVDVIVDRMKWDKADLSTAFSRIAVDVENVMKGKSPERISKEVDRQVRKAIASYRGVEFVVDMAARARSAARSDDEDGELPAGIDPEARRVDGRSVHKRRARDPKARARSPPGHLLDDARPGRTVRGRRL